MRFNDFAAARIGVLSGFGEPDLQALVDATFERASKEPATTLDNDYWFGIAHGLINQGQPSEQVIEEISSRLAKDTTLPSATAATSTATAGSSAKTSPLLIGIGGLAVATTLYFMFKG